jgi:hypothetical protein
MGTVKNDNDLCKGFLETVSGVMVPVAESCGRDSRASVRVGTHKKISRAPRLLRLGARARAQLPHVAFGPTRAAVCVRSPRRPWPAGVGASFPGAPGVGVIALFPTLGYGGEDL